MEGREPASQLAPDRAGPRATRIATWVGAAAVLIGLLANHWLLGRVLGSGGAVSDPADRAIIWIFQAMMISWGAMNLAFRRRAIVAKLNLMMASLLLVSPLLGEVALRVAISMRIPAICDAGLYADALSEDDHWKLRHIWTGQVGGDRVVADPLLGWAPPATPQNALGAYSPTAYDLNELADPILVFGDSFIDSPAGVDNAIPAIMDEIAAERRVLNLGVSGYGVDQILLRLQQTRAEVTRGAVVFGVLTSDLDRSVLRFRGAAKPRFQLEGERLAPPALVAEQSIDQWVSENPPQIVSYLLAFAKMRFRLHQPGEFREHAYRRDEKRRLNAKLLEKAVELDRAEAPLYFVLFYEPEELGMVGWREQFLLAEMERLNAKFLDTKPLLLDESSRLDEHVKTFYRTDHHLNRRGNEVVARAITEMLETSENR